MSRLILLSILGLIGFSIPALAAQSAGPTQLPPDLDFVLIDRTGTAEVLGPAPLGSYSPRVSPDGKQLVVDAIGGVWIADLANVPAARVLVPGKAQWPSWSPDGKSVVYTGESEGQQTVFLQSLDGAPASLLIRPARAVESWSRQHGVLTFIELAAEGDYGIWQYSLQDDRRNLLINAAPTAQNSSQFSPDGTMIAYASNETGRFEVYLQRYPGGGKVVRVTQDGGHHPVWSVDGKELLFDRDGKEFFVVAIDGRTLGVAAPVSLPVTGFVQNALRRQFDLTPEGKLLMLSPRQSGY
jgi:Tol biopolymer transport system component